MIVFDCSKKLIYVKRVGKYLCEILMQNTSINEDTKSRNHEVTKSLSHKATKTQGHVDIE